MRLMVCIVSLVLFSLSISAQTKARKNDSVKFVAPVSHKGDETVFINKGSKVTNPAPITAPEYTSYKAVYYNRYEIRETTTR